MYALSRRRDLPLFSSLFRAKIRTRILSSPFECIRAPDRYPVNHMGRVNFQHLTKYSLRNFVSPTPCRIRRPLSLSHFPRVPLLPPPFRTDIGAAKALPSFLPSHLPGTMRWAPCSSFLGGSARLPTPSEHQRKLPRVLSKKKT